MILSRTCPKGSDDIQVLKFNRKDAKICEASKIDLLVERLEAVIDGQPEIADEDELSEK